MYQLCHKHGWQDLRDAGEGVAKCRSKVTGFEKELFEVVGRQGKEDMAYWRSAEKIARIMAAKNEVRKEAWWEVWSGCGGGMVGDGGRRDGRCRGPWEAWWGRGGRCGGGCHTNVLYFSLWQKCINTSFNRWSQS